MHTHEHPRTPTHTHIHKYMYVRMWNPGFWGIAKSGIPEVISPEGHRAVYMGTYRHSCWPYSRVVTPVPVNKVYKCTYDPNLYSNQWILPSHGYPTGIFNPKPLPTPAPAPPPPTTTTTTTTTCLLLSLQHFLVQWCCNHSQILLQCEAPHDGDSSLLLTEFGKVLYVHNNVVEAHCYASDTFLSYATWLISNGVTCTASNIA